MLELLNCADIDVNIKDKRGDTPLHGTQRHPAELTILVAVKSSPKNGDITAVLLAKGADINLINNKGEDIVHLASGEALQAVRAFKEDLLGLRKRFPIVTRFIGMLTFGLVLTLKT